MPRPTSPKPSSATQSAEPQNDVAMPRAIIFDLDDTLVDQAGAARRAVVGWAAEHGITGVGVVVLTNCDDAHQRLKLGLTGLAADVDLLVSTSTLPASKPDPRAYWLTCERAGIAPAEALMVGNSLSHDVLGPIEAGLDATLLDRHDAHPEAAVRRISTLRDLSW